MSTISGGAKLEGYLSALAAKYGEARELKVGFLAGAVYPNGTPVAMIAAIQNFGAPSRGIPPRPFFSNMVDGHKNEWGPMVAGELEHGADGRVALDAVGQVIAGQLRESIVETNTPPNSPVTNLLKQRFPKGGQTFGDVLQARRDVAAGVTAPAGKPLVQSGDMLASVDSVVT